MSRELRSIEEINGMIRAEMRKHEACANVSLGSVYWHEPDETGCNWDASMARGDPDEVRPCRDCIIEAIRNLRAQYNIPYSE